jgi:hypothetical protein
LLAGLWLRFQCQANKKSEPEERLKFQHVPLFFSRLVINLKLSF